MNNIIIIISLLSLTFTQELKVEGNLNVTGHIQNQTIDSLLQVIQDLQNQINSMNSGNKLETRVYEVEVVQGDIISLSQITEYNLEYYIVSIIGATNIPNQNGAVYLSIPNDGGNNNAELSLNFYEDEHIYGVNQVWWGNISSQLLYIDELQYFGHNTTLKITITAQFPSEPPTQQSQTTSKQSK